MTKLLVGLGNAVPGVTKNIEIIDLELATTTCNILPDFPMNLIGSIGGLGFEDKPIICGGSDETSSYINKCYSLNESEWMPSPNMLSVKTYAAVSVSPNLTSAHKLIVTGGLLSSTASTNTVEGLTPNGWETLPPSLPANIYLHCSVLVNSTTLMVIGGIQNDLLAFNTYFFNLDKKMWNVGPALKAARCQQSCGRIKKDSTSPELSLIVAGG